MILVTGGTGFIGQALIRRLVAMNMPVRILLRPSRTSPNLPRGVPVEAVVCSLNDERGLRAAMKDVDIIYHLASAEHEGTSADLMGVDMQGTRNVAAAAAEAGVQRMFALSHIGASRQSAYPVLKAKAFAEGFIAQSGVHYTIFRPAVVFGQGDHFTTSIVRMMRMIPGVFFMPGQGDTLLQPLWVEDLVTCLSLSLDNSATLDRIVAIGGPEFLSFRQIFETVKHAAGMHGLTISLSQGLLRKVTPYLEHGRKNFPLSIFWQDYLAAARTCELDTLPRLFGLMPERMGRQLHYLSPSERKRSHLLRPTQ